MQMPPVQPPQKKNTTVIVLIVLAALGVCCVPILAALLFPVFSQAKLSARKAASVSDAHVIALALAVYSVDYDDHLPHQFSTTEDLRGLLGEYVKEDLDFSTANPVESFFVPNPSAAGLSTVVMLDPATAILFYESMPWEHDGGRVVGHADASATYDKSFVDPDSLLIPLIDEKPIAP